LGAPLFRELISEKTLRRLLTWKEFAHQKAFMNVPQDTPGTFHGKHLDVYAMAAITRALYWAGFDAAGGASLWSDPEQFLETLEIASSEPDGVLAKELRWLLRGVKDQGSKEPSFDDALKVFEAKDGLVHIHREAVRLVAAACSMFLLRAEANPALVRESEQWSPYRRWVRKLRAGSDSVITFNYDRVLNILNEYLLGLYKGSLHNPPVLDSPVGCNLDKFDAQRSGTIPMYHLHGHVGWQTAPNGEVQCGKEESNGLRPDVARAHIEPALALMGTPGKSKTGLHTGLLQEAWRRAMMAISEATTVVFVGYRFPETDSVAKEQLADALRNNPKAIVHVVLGANNVDMPRLKGMIEWTRDKNTNPVHVHEMWCQDFFAVFERNGL